MKNLQGKEAINRMLELMGKAPINENTKNSVVELTKVGPDGKVYGIVRENHEYYIKIANATDNLVVENFNYIGGLSNKKNEVYPSYSKALKQLNLKFISLNESIGKYGQVNVFLNDNLITEHHPYKADQALSATKDVEDEFEKVKLSENESAIDSMITGEETEKVQPTKKAKISISKAINEMDDIINSVNVKSKVETLLEGLSIEEMTELTNALKKKV